MCGIAGIYHLNQKSLDPLKLKRFTDSMLHRGPDASGYEFADSNTLGLGQRRLSILDLSELGKQPMYYGDGRYLITYNGEIFNFRELRAELADAGYKFRSETDTEVIMAAYMKWGPACLDKFNGMWAFAIWDAQKHELFLSRDRFGIKPLYYTFQSGKMFAFASETRAFKFLDGFNRETDAYLLELNLRDPYSLEGNGYTPFKNILQVLPGHYMYIRNNTDSAVQKRWWHIEDHLHEKFPDTFTEQSEKFYNLLRDSCKLRLVSDVPLGTALSGGLDSTAIYSTVHEILRTDKLSRVNSDSQRAFTAIFPGLPQDEQAYAAKAAAYIKGPIEYIEIENEKLPEIIESETRLSDYVSTSPISSISAIYRGMRNKGITVSLDGHGVDEMMYGYRDMVYALYNQALWNGSVTESRQYSEVLSNMYHPDLQSEKKNTLDSEIQQKVSRETSLKYRFKTLLGKQNNLTYTRTNYTFGLPSLSDRPYDFSNKSISERIVYNEFFLHTLPALLRNFDRAGMMNSVEIRMPFMDWRLVTYVFSLPVNSKIGQGFTKLLLREAMKNRMDESLRNRTYKVGISSPLDYWMNGPLKEWTLDTLQDIGLKKQLESAYKAGNSEAGLNIKVWFSINASLIQ